MAAKRKRDYKAEYAKRLARGAVKGKTRQQARGHKAKEHVVRAQRSKAKYGVSPSTLTRLRAQAKDKLVAAYKIIARNPYQVSDDTVRRGMRLLHAEDLRAIIAWDGIQITNMKNELSPLDPAADSYYGQLEKYFPASVDDINAADHNPGWYH